MSKKIIECRLCQKNTFNKLFEDNGFEIKQCLKCGFGTLDPIPNQKELNSLYENEYHAYISDKEFVVDAQKKLGTILKYIGKPGKLLDFGTGIGHFLNLAKSKGFRVQGHDISSSAAKKAYKLYRLKLVTEAAKTTTFDKNSFDLITSFDVIEHIPDFMLFLKFFNMWLKPGGLPVLTTPDLDVWDRKLLGQKWYGYTRIPQHINYFNRSSMVLTLKKMGFEIVTIKTFGFVRSVGYLSKQISGSTWLQKILRIFSIDKKTVYLPMTDMLVVARKIK